MRLIRANGKTVHPGDRFDASGTSWTYVRPGVPPDPNRHPPFVGRVVMRDEHGDEVEKYPQEFGLNYTDD